MASFEEKERSIEMGEITGSHRSNTMQQAADIKVRSKLRLGEVERLIKKHRIIVPGLSRQTLQNMCEDGTFETAGDKPGRLGWLVYEDSFWKWASGTNSDL